MDDLDTPPGDDRDAAPRGPVLGVCGWSGSGKTTLLEAVIPRLAARGLRVAVLKHDGHGPDLDRPGKDSDRLFRAGADIALIGPDEALERRHRRYERGLGRAAGELLRRHDIVLVEGHKATPMLKVWLAGPDDAKPPREVTDVLAVLPWGADREALFLRVLDDWLPAAWTRVPVWAGILIGGGSTRMGRAKHLLRRGGRTYLERLVDAVAPHAAGIALVGDGNVPPALASAPRLPDAPDVSGPLAGMLAAMRWLPGAAWLLAACDLPFAGDEVVQWLLAQRRPGRWAVVPSLREGMFEPLFALYEPQAAPLLEEVAAGPNPAPRLIAHHEKVATPAPPPALRRGFFNVNVPADLAGLDPE
jgi:glutamate dehydrogenase (NADP+)/cyclic pyranopterin phosphate synthase/molybdopterin-guanine dinucleotide biosynthesis protein A